MEEQKFNSIECNLDSYGSALFDFANMEYIQAELDLRTIQFNGQIY